MGLGRKKNRATVIIETNTHSILLQHSSAHMSAGQLALLGDSLVGKTGPVPTAEALAGKVVGIYFSARTLMAADNPSGAARPSSSCPVLFFPHFLRLALLSL